MWLVRTAFWVGEVGLAAARVRCAEPGGVNLTAAACGALLLRSS